MKSLIFVTCLTVIVAHETAHEHDDEVVVVEDVVEDEKPKYRYDGDSTSSSSSSSKSSNNKPAASTDEVLATMKKHLTKLAAKQRKWLEYEDDGTVASFASSLDKGYIAFEYRHAGLVAQHAKEPEKNVEQYELAVELQKQYTQLQNEVAAQVARHQALMRSCVEIVDSKVLKNSKNLGKYIRSRLKAKTLAKRLSSRANIEEMFKLQELVRGARLHGLGDKEIVDLIIWCIVPALCLLGIRMALISYRIFDFPSLSISNSVDIITTTIPPLIGLAFVLYRAGPQFLTTSQLTINFLITGFFQVSMLLTTRGGLRAARNSNIKKKKKKH